MVVVVPEVRGRGLLTRMVAMVAAFPRSGRTGRRTPHFLSLEAVVVRQGQMVPSLALAGTVGGRLEQMVSLFRALSPEVELATRQLEEQVVPAVRRVLLQDPPSPVAMRQAVPMVVAVVVVVSSVAVAALRRR